MSPATSKWQGFSFYHWEQRLLPLLISDTCGSLVTLVKSKSDLIFISLCVTGCVTRVISGEWRPWTRGSFSKWMDFLIITGAGEEKMTIWESGETHGATAGLWPCTFNFIFTDTCLCLLRHEGRRSTTWPSWGRRPTWLATPWCSTRGTVATKSTSRGGWNSTSAKSWPRLLIYEQHCPRWFLLVLHSQTCWAWICFSKYQQRFEAKFNVCLSEHERLLKFEGTLTPAVLFLSELTWLLVLRLVLVRSTKRLWKKDGLSSCKYQVLSLDRLPLYVNITVDIGKPFNWRFQLHTNCDQKNYFLEFFLLFFLLQLYQRMEFSYR